ncbi:MAG: hypothetical protein AAF628_09130 [Planctomycetota bacterium]
MSKPPTHRPFHVRPGTRQRAALGTLVAGLLLTACARSPAVGTYRVDELEMRDQLGRVLSRLSKTEKEQMMGQMATMLESLSSTRYELREDHTYEATTGVDGVASTTKGTWKLNEDALTLSQTHRDDTPTVNNRTGTFYGHSIHFVQGEGRDRLELILRRLPASP